MTQNDFYQGLKSPLPHRLQQPHTAKNNIFQGNSSCFLTPTYSALGQFFSLSEEIGYKSHVSILNFKVLFTDGQTKTLNGLSRA